MIMRAKNGILNLGAFPRVEQLRAKAHALGFTPADDTEMARIRRADAESLAVNALEDLHPTAEDRAFYQMMLDERLPRAMRASLSREYIDLTAGD